MIGNASATDATNSQRVISKFVGVYTTPPDKVGIIDKQIGAYRVPDGPLMGNGDMAVAVGGTPTSQTFYVSKGDMDHSNRGIGGVTLAFGDVAGNSGSYRLEQDIYKAEVRSRIPLKGTMVEMRSWTADGTNLLVAELKTDGSRPVDVDLRVWSHCRGLRTNAGTENGIAWSTREKKDSRIGRPSVPFSSCVAMAVRVLGATTECSADGKASATARFTLPAGETVRIVIAVGGGYQVADHVPQAIKLATSQTDASLDRLREDHLAWWRGYWDKSFIEIDEEWVERFYYGAIYALGCASRAGSVAPGLAGPWHLDGPICWGNRYTLDYNFQSLWWGVYSSNRAELAMPFYDAILKIVPAGKLLAIEHETKGVLFPVNAHGYGGFTDTRTLNMKGNAALAALNFMNHYNYTQDECFLVDTAWPLLKELVVFWEDNLVWDKEKSRWMVLDSGCREGRKDNNAINDLGHLITMYRFLLRNADVLEGKLSRGVKISISSEQKKRWRSYVENMSAFPTTRFTHSGSKATTVFMEAENRNRMSLGMSGDNSDVLMHVFPSEAISLGSDPKLLEIARNTVLALNPEDQQKKSSWYQANCFPKIYTQAVRSGYPAGKVIKSLTTFLKGEQPYDDRDDHVKMHKNMTICPPVHSFESVGAVEAINSMLLQSHDQVLRLFPVWIKGKDASFHQLRAHGGFLVSSAYQGGQVTHIDVRSDAGRPCTILNPWPGKGCVVKSNDSTVAVKVDGDLIRFKTERGRRYTIRLR